MYGTIAHMRVRKGQQDQVRQMMQQMEQRPMAGFVASHVYRLDSDPQELMVAVLFADKDSYVRNADDPAQDVEYRKLRDLLERDPEWHDGEVIWSTTAA
jgi:heme-degrading monooxygenase HmoA